MANKTRSGLLPLSLREMINAAQKYNTTISGMRASMDQRLNIPAFYHPYVKNRNLQNISKVMKCLQHNHNAKTVRDLLQIVTMNERGPVIACPLRNLSKKKCGEKATELLNRINDKWNPGRETPKRHNLWHIPQRVERYRKADPVKSLVLFNPISRPKRLGERYSRNRSTVLRW